MKMETVTIKRSQWLTPDRFDFTKYGSRLWSKSRNAGCCLGHCLMQLHNVPKNEISKPNRCLPDEVEFSGLGSEKTYEFYDQTIIFNSSQYEYRSRESELEYHAANINDDERLTSKQRESKLKKLFKLVNVNLKFVD
jgi:hypothetical protein